MNNKDIVKEILKESSSVWFTREGLWNEIKYFDSAIESPKPTDTLKVPVFVMEDVELYQDVEEFMFFLLSNQCQLPQRMKVQLIKFPNRKNLIIGVTTESDVTTEVTEFINKLNDSKKLGFKCSKFSTSSYFSLDIKIS